MNVPLYIYSENSVGAWGVEWLVCLNSRSFYITHICDLFFELDNAILPLRAKAHYLKLIRAPRSNLKTKGAKAKKNQENHARQENEGKRDNKLVLARRLSFMRQCRSNSPRRQARARVIRANDLGRGNGRALELTRGRREKRE